MQSRSITSYGGPYSDSRPVSDPTTQVSSEELNVLLEDAAQLTRLPWRVAAMFVTNSVSDPTVVSYAKTMWGTGVSFAPTVARTGNGQFSVTFAASYTDGLDEEETLALADAGAKQEFLASGFTPRLTFARAAGNVIHVALYTVGGSLVDTTGDRITVWGL